MTSTTTAISNPAPLMLSVSGARGIVGKTMTPPVAAEFAAAFGTFVRESTGRDQPLLCVGRDSRPSGEMLAAAAAAGLAAVGCRVIDLGIVTTPTVGVMIGRHDADGGLVITASHNPIMWNGLKCLNADGLAPPADEAAVIIQRFREREINYADVERIRPLDRDRSGNESHVAKVLANVDAQPIRSAGFRVVLDSVNGAGCVAGRMLLDELGCEVAHLNGEPTGIFAHTPEPVKENLTDLASTTASSAAAIGFAQDPDADRLAIIDENGVYIGEEYSLVLAAKRLLDLHGGRGMVLAINLSTSRMIDDLAARYDGATVLRAPVGEANVAAALKAADGTPLMGGEGNGGVIFPPVTWVRDSLSAMALVLSLMAAEGKPLSAIVADLPRYEMIKRKMDLTAIGGTEALPRILEKVADGYSGERIDTADGVRIDFADGWVHLRPSNTEPIIRLIAEAETTQRAEALIADVSSAAGLG
jgi:phosphomannomutase